MSISSLSNQYVECLDRGVFDEIPKAVWAAIAISLATTGGDYLENATANILEEWKVLHQNGIVPQSPPHRLLSKLNITKSAEGIEQ